MICPNCNKHVDSSYKFCNNCGKRLEYIDSYDDIYKTTITSDEDYIKYYIGNKYETIKQEKFSIPAFIFGPLYMIYRKMYLYGLLLLATIILLSYYNVEVGCYIFIIINLYLGFKFNRIYMNNANQKTEEIKISNPDKTSIELLEICQKKGSTVNILILILLITITITIVFIALSEYKNNINTPINNKNYYEINDIKYKVLDNYNKGQFKSKSYDFYSYHKDNTSCYITIKSTPNNNYKSTDDYIIKYSKTTNNINDIKINNNTWRKMIINDELTIYAINYNNNYYLIKFDSNNISCNDNESIFMNNITFKGTK